MKIYQTYRNSDMTEGRGPMVPDLAFTTLKTANDYIDAQHGIMGRKEKWSEQDFGDWQVKEIDVWERAPSKMEADTYQVRRTALNKLSRIERVVLGLEEP